MPGPWENLPETPRPRSTRTASRLGLWLWLGAIGGLAALAFALNRMFPGSLGAGGIAGLVQGIGWFALVSSSLLFIRQVNLKRAARNLLLWVGVFGVALLGYAYRDTLGDAAARLQGLLLPGKPIATGAHELTLGEDDGGGYHVIGAVNGARVRFIVDTGASDIVLTAADARAAGIDPDTLDYSRPYATANGIARGAVTTVTELKVGGIVLNDVQVSVQRDGLGVSLLGMSFLRRLKSFGFGDHRLVLRW